MQEVKSLHFQFTPEEEEGCFRVTVTFRMTRGEPYVIHYDHIQPGDSIDMTLQGNGQGAKVKSGETVDGRRLEEWRKWLVDLLEKSQAEQTTTLQKLSGEQRAYLQDHFRDLLPAEFAGEEQLISPALLEQIKAYKDKVGEMEQRVNKLREEEF